MKMTIRFMLSSFALALMAFALVASTASAGNILLVTDNGWRHSRAAGGANEAPAGTFPEDDFAAFLTGLGHNVVVSTGVDGGAQFRNSNGGAPSAAQLGPGGLFASGTNLVIVSRVTDSGQYNNAGAWNSISTPLLLMSPHLARSSRWKWADSGDASTVVRPTDMVYPDPNDPLIAGFGTSLLNPAGQLSTTLNQGAPLGNGDVVATLDGHQAIVQWATGQEFYAGAGQFAGGPRVLFTGLPYHEDHNGGPATFNDFSFNGKAVLAHTIAHLAVPEPSSVVLGVMGVVGLLAYGWRRRNVA